MPSTIESATFDIAPWASSVGAYAGWIDHGDSGTPRLWARRLKPADDARVQGTVVEAIAWGFLANKVDAINSGSVPKGPDFGCRSTGPAFFVEVTNIASPVVKEREVCATSSPGGLVEWPAAVPQ